MPRTKVLWIRERALSQILAGRKTIEVRVGYENIRRLQPGDLLRLNDQHLVLIRRIGRYADFAELLAHESPAAIAPDIPAGDLLPALRELYPAEKEALGAIALEITLASASSSPPAGTIQERHYDAVLFDMGYTLVYFEPPQEAIIQEALRATGVERTADQILAAVEVVWGEFYREAATVGFPPSPEYDRGVQAKLSQGLLAQLGLATDPETMCTYTTSLEAGFSRPGAIRVYPEVAEVLTTLQQQGYRLGIVSNWSWNLRDRVRDAGLQDFFEIVWASAYAGYNKPHPAIFRHVLEQMTLPAGRALYVGDSYRHDVVGARNAGIDPVLLDRDGTAGDADCPIIHDLRGVFDLLR